MFPAQQPDEFTAKSDPTRSTLRRGAEPDAVPGGYLAAYTDPAGHGRRVDQSEDVAVQ